MEDNLPPRAPENQWPVIPLEQGLTFETTPHFSQGPEPKARLVLLVQLVLFALFLLLGWLLFQLISSLAGWDTIAILSGKPGAKRR